MARKKDTPAPEVAGLPALAGDHPVTGELTPAKAFLKAGGLALERARRFLEPQINLEQLVDPAWLAHPENRRAAMVQLKLAALQKDVALSLISDQLRVGEKWRERELEEARRALLLENLGRKFQERSADDLAPRKPTPG